MGLTHPGLGPKGTARPTARGMWNPDTAGDTALESGALRQLHSVGQNSGRGRGSRLRNLQEGSLESLINARLHV